MSSAFRWCQWEILGCNSWAFTAKPTSRMRQKPSGTPFQKKVYPTPTSVRDSSPCSLVSLRAAISMLYFASSRATSAVLRRGLSGALDKSSSVRTFHDAIDRYLFLWFFVFRPQTHTHTELDSTNHHWLFYEKEYDRKFPQLTQTISGVEVWTFLVDSCTATSVLQPSLPTQL